MIAPSAAMAESNEQLAAEIKELKAQIHAMQGAISQNRSETRRTQQKIKAVASRSPAPYAAQPSLAIPQDATPVFVTASKQLQFGALTITPGGFIAGESVYRTRTTNSDISSNFAGIPTQNNPLAHTGEFRPSARNTRAALLVEAAITPRFLVAGYGEFDFLSATNTANSNQSNSYTPRIRHLYATLDDTDGGFHVLAGQAYSLVTLNSKGITPRNEVTPTVIDGSQTVGSIYARQAQIRLVKDFDKKLWLGISAEESETTFAPGCTTANGAATGVQGNNPGSTFGFNNVSNITCSGVGTIANSGQTNFSLNHAPDVVGKAAYEANLAGHDLHLEGFGLYTNLYDRVESTLDSGALVGTNTNKSGWGVGGGFIAAVIPRRLDVQGNVLYGRGIGRYGPAQLADASYSTDGSLSALPEVIALAGATFHATPSIDIYGYAGLEQGSRSYNMSPTGVITGVGGPNIVDTGCYLEGSASATCTGTTRREIELTGGFWDKIYKGSFGEVRVGAQYAFIQRDLFNAPGLSSPRTNDHEVFTSFRYYPFQ